MSRYESVFTADDLPITKLFNPTAGFDFAGQLDSLLQDLVDAGHITTEDDASRLTQEGRRALKRRIARARFGVFA